MPTKRIDSDETWPQQTCQSPDHNPPNHFLFPNGAYEHTCSACGKVTIFTVNRPVYTNHPGWHSSDIPEHQRPVPMFGRLLAK